MNIGWASQNIENCLEPIRAPAKVPRKAFLDQGVYPIVSQEHGVINGYWSKEGDVLRVKKPLVVYGDHTRCLKYIDFDFVVGAEGVKLLQPKSFLVTKYFYYFLRGHPVRSLGYSRHYRLLRELDICFPESKSEQRRIVTILDEALAGIDAGVTNAERNLVNARELFESYLNSVFTQSGEGWTNTNVQALIGEGIFDKPRDGNHGEIHPKKADFTEGGVPFIMASDLVEGQVNQTTCNFISRDQADSLRKGFARDGDVLLSHKGTIGRTAVLETALDYVMLTPQVTYYRILNKALLSNRFLFYFFQSPRFQGAMTEIANEGSTRAYIGITKQLILPVAFPVLADQYKFVEAMDVLVESTRSLREVLEKKVRCLGQLRQSLLHRAFTGELTARPSKHCARPPYERS